LRHVELSLAAHGSKVRDVVETPEGQELCEKAFNLIEFCPWLMKSLAKWTLQKTTAFHSQAASLLVERDERIESVEGYNSPPSQALTTLAASKTGEPISIVKNLAKGVIASLPIIGSVVSKHLQDLQESLDGIQINGVSPSSKADWKLVLLALHRDQAINAFHENVLEPMSVLEGWPLDEFYDPNANQRRLRREIVDSLSEAIRVKELACDLDISDLIDLTFQVRNLDLRRTTIAERMQQLVAELVDATVIAEMSRSFSAEAQSALIKFAQIAGKAKFAKSTQLSKMTQRQRRHRQEYLDAFEKCVRHIPCWILTSSQISDYLPSECLFDLVILDEASQSDVTVLPGMLRGKQWLIVGDGKQVSPTDGFVAEEHIERLKAVLPQSPLEDSLLPGHSFFDLCAQAYPKGRVSAIRRGTFLAGFLHHFDL
jgi:AAA domain